MKKTVSVVWLLVFMTLFVGCNKQQPNGGEMSSNPTVPAIRLPWSRRMGRRLYAESERSFFR